MGPRGRAGVKLSVAQAEGGFYLIGPWRGSGSGGGVRGHRVTVCLRERFLVVESSVPHRETALFHTQLSKQAQLPYCDPLQEEYGKAALSTVCWKPAVDDHAAGTVRRASSSSGGCGPSAEPLSQSTESSQVIMR
ncbi:hypothetical protein EYF80_008095 [Liparis tanakae]|uniref:Uncharacterized protein n=1 Tax=Liparis tanakae TaxID=230148 RepID=A0A4Z2IUG2_9TELE|nr:hypothetical protein EYF80_008095 [Liparis tanakae]